LSSLKAGFINRFPDRLSRGLLALPRRPSSLEGLSPRSFNTSSSFRLSLHLRSPRRALPSSFHPFAPSPLPSSLLSVRASPTSLSDFLLASLPPALLTRFPHYFVLVLTAHFSSRPPVYRLSSNRRIRPFTARYRHFRPLYPVDFSSPWGLSQGSEYTIGIGLLFHRL